MPSHPLQGRAERLRATSFVLDGEGVTLRPDGVADFDRLHSRRHDGEVQLLGLDLLELDQIVRPVADDAAAIS